MISFKYKYNNTYHCHKKHCELYSVKNAYCEFLNFHEGVELYRNFKHLLYGSSDSLAQWINKELINDLIPKQQKIIKICDIGGGDGDRIGRIISYIHKQFQSNCYLDLIEQSSTFASYFDVRNLRQFCEVRIFSQRFEDASIPSRNYDLVFLIHSIFAFESVEVIQKALSLANANGKIILVSNSSSSFLAGLKAIVDDDLSEKRIEISDIEEILKAKNIKFSKYLKETSFTIPFELESRLFDTIVEWISLGRFSSYSSEKKCSIRNYITNCATTDSTGLLFCEEETVLVIHGDDGLITNN